MTAATNRPVTNYCKRPTYSNINIHLYIYTDLCKNLRQDWQRRKFPKLALCFDNHYSRDPHKQNSQVLKGPVGLLMCLLCFGCLLTEVCVETSGTEVSRAQPIREDEMFQGRAAVFRARSVETLRNLNLHV